MSAWGIIAAFVIGVNFGVLIFALVIANRTGRGDRD